MYLEIKVEQWKRVELPECATKEQVIELLKKGNSENGFDHVWEEFSKEEYNWDLCLDDCDCGYERVLDPVDNSGNATVELKEKRYEPSFWTNKPEYPDTIRLEWSICDFESEAQEKEGVDLESGEEYTEESPMLYNRSKFPYALSLIAKRHDCNYGVTWETVCVFLDEYCKL